MQRLSNLVMTICLLDNLRVRALPDVNFSSFDGTVGPERDDAWALLFGIWLATAIR